MSMADGIVDKLALLAESKAVHNDGDYIGEDGLLYCGNCHTRKQLRIELLGRERIVHCDCKCEAEKYEAEREKALGVESEAEFAIYRRTAMEDEKYREMIFTNSISEYPSSKQMKMALKYCEQWDKMKKENRWLIFSGATTGVGKTYIAACIANKLLDNRVKVYMATMGTMLDGVSKFETSDAMMNRIGKCDLLIIDDFGAERTSDFGSEKVFEIIDKRVRTGKPAIITTNITKKELMNPKGIRQGRLYSRLMEKSVVFEIKGDDMRMKKSLENEQTFMQSLFD